MLAAMRYFLVLTVLLFSQAAFAQSEVKQPLEPYRPNQTKQTDKTAPSNKPYSQFKTNEQRREGKHRQPNVEIWLPPEFQSSEKKWPVIIFSHGFGGCAKQSKFLTSYLADQGYIVLAPDHADANCERIGGNGAGSRLQAMRSGNRGRPEKPFRTPEAWTDKTEGDRRDDVLFALSSMLDDRQYKNYVDLDHVGLMGHSLGGYTVLGLAGAWPSWKDKRFKAVLAMSPYIQPYLLNGGLRKVGVPVMYQGGTKDDPITPLVRGKGYKQAQVPKYYIELDGANHFAWTELEKGYQDIIQRTALAFFDKYLKDKPVEIDEHKKPKISTFWKDEGKGP